MIKQIIDLIQTHTSITEGEPSGLTTDELNKIYSNLTNHLYPNTVPKLGTLLGSRWDKGELTTDHNKHGKLIWLHKPTLEELQKEVNLN